MINRREFMAKMTALAASGVLAEQASAAPQVSNPAGQARLNILIFMPDQQQGATVLPEHPCLTPHIDKFAAEGLLFPNAFCPAPHCCPSRATFQSGLYPSEHGVFNNVDTDSAIHLDPMPGTPYFIQSLHDAGCLPRPRRCASLRAEGRWAANRRPISMASAARSVG